MSGSRQESTGIDYFGRGHWLTEVQIAASIRVRKKMFDSFCDFAGDLKGKTVLDVGATPDTQRADSNCMIPWLLAKGARVTLYSPENIDLLKPIFPAVEIMKTPEWEKLKSAEKFDWIISSAVIEHVGNQENQIRFLSDLADRARGLFVTTPARFHWMEFHTKIPFLHWLPKKMHRWILRLLGKNEWAKEDHLNLLSKGELTLVARRALSSKFSAHLHSAWFLGMPSNLFLLAHRPKGE